MTTTPKLTLGPVLFNWKPEVLRDFYFRMADEADVDSVHVGEVVCSKRTPFFEPFIPEVVERLTAAGKEVVLSSLALIMSDREIAQARDLAQSDGILVEANDISVAAQMNGRPFVAGPLLNIYNEGTLAALAAMGAARACLPAELAAEAVTALATSTPMDIEVQAFGRLPLAISARCYAARARNLSKDGCQYVCADDPDGMAVETLDDVPFLAVNGTQTMSYHTMDLLGDVAGLAARGIGRFRLWPQTFDMVAVAALFRAVLAGTTDAGEAEDRLATLCPGAEFANGYIHGRPGHLFVEAGD
ncbi:ubiquinone anaerobic biosynthesis protein UbiV [Paramagnetospirillum magneticum]|uniref:Ubiquinone biosynthesis protein UbiV n=1 Tax=Paramagnetospirillum magneticum (strain ATCC 700264 / AMB-1) TaxID=342108 RepID=Q2WA31_PARM1|nr:U32 family peptidase [Paramagnetospirillum magneticum]BAE49294.1 Collagenase and related protease [Paramagnetospirillum magneticum AMB-1]